MRICGDKGSCVQAINRFYLESGGQEKLMDFTHAANELMNWGGSSTPKEKFNFSFIVISLGGGGGGAHTLRPTGMCCPNGLLFHQKSLDMGPILFKNILRRVSHFTKIEKKNKKKL